MNCQLVQPGLYHVIFKAFVCDFLGLQEYSNTRIFDRRNSEYSNSGSQCQLSPLKHSLQNNTLYYRHIACQFLGVLVQLCAYFAGRLSEAKIIATMKNLTQLKSLELKAWSRRADTYCILCAIPATVFDGWLKTSDGDICP